MTEVVKPSRERLTELFLGLTRIPSPSWHEREVADAVIGTLEGLGLQVTEDAAGEAIGGDCGNLVCRVGRDSRAVWLALGAHMDTVEPGGPIDAQLDAHGRFANANGGILGADDKAAIAALLHATELLLKGDSAFAPYELFFTVCEEHGLVGAKYPGPGRFAAR